MLAIEDRAKALYHGHRQVAMTALKAGTNSEEIQERVPYQHREPSLPRTWQELPSEVRSAWIDVALEVQAVERSER